MIRRFLLAAAALIAAAAPAHAQLEPGQRIRLAAPENGVFSVTAGTLMEVRPDTLVIEIRGMQRTVARSGITHLEVSRGRRADASTAMYGAIFGAAAGFGAGWLHHKIASEGESADELTVTRNRRPEFAIAGGIIGLVIGTFRPGDRWEVLPLDVAVPQGTGGAALTLTFRF